jgi:hypothetical protein
MGNARKDRLCGKHAEELKKGNIIINKTGLFADSKTNKILNSNYKTNDTTILNQSLPKTEMVGDGKCIVCSNEAPNGHLCRKCYYEMKDYYGTTFDKNSKVFELKDYYFNLRQNIYRMKNFEFVKSNCNKLYALSSLVKDVYSDESLSDRIVKDIKEIVSQKKPMMEKKPNEDTNTKDSRREELLRTADGHYVKSHPESIIDDILYELRIVHCYEKKVPIDIDEQAVICDWFIPILNNRSGIYIEYWGMNTKEYLANKERKKAAYSNNNIPIIEIEKDDYLDKQSLSDRLIQEINKLAKDRFKVSDFIRIF